MVLDFEVGWVVRELGSCEKKNEMKKRDWDRGALLISFFEGGSGVEVPAWVDGINLC